MDPLLRALTNAINAHPILSLICASILLFGLGGFIREVILMSIAAFAARREGAQKDEEIARLRTLLKDARNQLVGLTDDHPDRTDITRQLSGALNDRNVLMDLLRRVQALDRAFPQLDQSLRSEIDAAMSHFYPAPPAINPGPNQGRPHRRYLRRRR